MKKIFNIKKNSQNNNIKKRKCRKYQKIKYRAKNKSQMKNLKKKSYKRLTPSQINWDKIRKSL